MKQLCTRILFTILVSMVGAKVFAYDIAVENADGLTIYYNYSSDATELIVTGRDYYYYSGSVVIPEEVTYMNRTRKVTSIGASAFSGCSITSVTIPNSVTSIGDYAFLKCYSLTSVTIPNSVTSIGNGAFQDCRDLTSLAIPNSVTNIGDGAFEYCYGLTSVTIGNSVTNIAYRAFHSCHNLTFVTIGNSVTSIGDYAFYECYGLTSVTIPNSVTTIGVGVFRGCTGLTSVTIPNSVTNIGGDSFSGCSSLTSVTIGNSVTTIGGGVFLGCTGLTSVTIPNSVTSIGDGAFSGIDLPYVVSLIENPFGISGKNSEYGVFSKNTFNNATLYVPVGSIDKYKATEGWKDFLFIEEGTGPNGSGTQDKEKCDKPTISYQNGKLIFNCATEGATCQYTITDDDITSGSSNEVQLGVTYNISVYAAKSGYDNSETATATLCWIDVEPKTEGIENSVANVRANPVLIQSNGSTLTISGAEAGTAISVYDTSGRMVASTLASAGTTTIDTSLRRGEICILKIGEKSVKILMK